MQWYMWVQAIMIAAFVALLAWMVWTARNRK